MFYKNINIFCCVSFLRTNFIKKILKKYILLLFIFNITKYNSQKIFSRIQTRCFLWRCILMKKNIFQVNMLGQKVDPLFPPSSYRNGPSSYWNGPSSHGANRLPKKQVFYILKLFKSIFFGFRILQIWGYTRVLRIDIIRKIILIKNINEK